MAFLSLFPPNEIPFFFGNRKSHRGDLRQPSSPPRDQMPSKCYPFRLVARHSAGTLQWPFHFALKWRRMHQWQSAATIWFHVTLMELSTGLLSSNSLFKANVLPRGHGWHFFSAQKYSQSSVTSNKQISMKIMLKVITATSWKMTHTLKQRRMIRTRRGWKPRGCNKWSAPSGRSWPAVEINRHFLTLQRTKTGEIWRSTPSEQLQQHFNVSFQLRKLKSCVWLMCSSCK